jgi:transcriptional regulator with XRE-family HTH domain
MAARPKDQDALSAFAEELKAWRAAQGWSQGELAARISYSESLIAQVETCRSAATMDMGKALDRVFRTPGYTEDAPGQPGTPGTFMRLAARIRKLSFPVAFRPFTDAEEEATALYIFEHSLFPGLFQIKEYARALVFAHPGVTEKQATERLDARLSRQGILARDNPPRVWVLIYEPVLRNLVDSPETMGRQLRHVVALARRPDVTIQVLPSGLHVASQGSFHIAEVDGVGTATFIADQTDGRTTQDLATINGLSERFRYLQTEAMTPSASREFMEKVAEETWSEA